ncbi:hypothetical protein RQP46_000740 [Phenoliferia psychrophenolica]
MAYGSVTAPTRVRTKTSTKTSTKTKASSAAPVASTSRLAPAPPPRRLSVPDPLTSGSDADDDDFGPAAKLRVQKEVRREERARAAAAAAKGKGKRKAKVEVVNSSDEDDKPKQRAKKRKAKEKAPSAGRDSQGTSEDDSSAADNSPAAKTRATKATKSSKGGYKRARKIGPEGENLSLEDVVKKHLQGRWRSRWQRDHPEYMSTKRQILEKKYNPLVKLLGIELQDFDSDQERGQADDLGSGSDHSDAPRKSENSDEDEDMDHFPSGRGHRLGSDTNMAHALKLPESDSDEDVKPNISVLDGEDVKPSIPGLAATASPGAASNLEPKTDESDPEPVTEDEDDEKPLIPCNKIEEEEEEEEEEEYEDPLALRLRLRREANARKEAAEAAEALSQQKKIEMERRIEALRAEQALEAAQRAADDDAMAVDEEEEEEPLSYTEQKHRDSLLHQAYPKRVKKGRPKFDITSLAQDSIGPHVLAPGIVVATPINRFLRSYQREGVDFMYRQYAAGKGGILGDDMGLGKTIQVIAFLSAIMGKTGMKKDDYESRKDAINAHKNGFHPPSAHGPTALVVCPASVVHNWEREFETWSYLRVGVYGGSNRKDVMEHFKRGYLDVVIAGFEATRTNIGELAELDFSVIITDEVHRVKNPLATTTKALHLFPTKLRYGLTGTAIQNNLEELWCILNWANPGSVGVLNNWRLYISRPLKFSLKVTADDDLLATGRLRAIALVDRLLPNFWIRRTKENVKLQLPKKTDLVVLCPLTDLQKRVYKKLLAHNDIKRILTSSDPCECGALDLHGRPYMRKFCCDPLWYKLILKYITLFQKISNHLELIYPDNEEKVSNPDKYNQDLEWARIAFPNDASKRTRSGLSSLDKTLCGKWPILEKLLALWHDQGDKVLIFSLSLKILDLVKGLMEQTHYKFVTLDGSVANDQRMELVDEFNNKPDVFCFLISTRAGGVGLNLTAANRVVIFDPNWNPSHDLQAMDRAYRFGQTRDVNVYRLVGGGTLEELIYNRQQYKRSQMNMGYDGTAEKRIYTGVEGEKDRFHEHSSLTEMSIQACNIADLEFALKKTKIGLVENGSPKGKGKLKGAKKGRRSDSMDGDSDQAVGVSDDEEEILKALVNPEEPSAQMSQKEAERAKKQEAERLAVESILSGSGVSTSLVSDATLGGSRAEQERSRLAIDGVSRRKSNGPAAKAKSKSKASAPPVATVAWNPAARKTGKAKLLAPTSAAPPVPDVKPSTKSSKASSSDGTLQSLADSLGIASDVPLEDLIAPSGYLGKSGRARLTEELDSLKSKGEAYNAHIQQILEAFARKEGQGGI